MVELELKSDQQKQQKSPTSVPGMFFVSFSMPFIICDLVFSPSYNSSINSSRDSDKPLGHIAGAPPPLPGTMRAFAFVVRDQMTTVAVVEETGEISCHGLREGCIRNFLRQ